MILFILCLLTCINTMDEIRDRRLYAYDKIDLEWDEYPDYETFFNTIKKFEDEYPDLIEMFPIGKSRLNRTIWAVNLTKENGMFVKPSILIVGCHHGREMISALIPLYTIDWFLENYFENSTVREILEKMCIYVIPMLNPDGYMEALERNPWQRKNAAPIDDDGDGLVDEDPPEDLDSDGLFERVLNLSDLLFYYEGLDNDSDGRWNEDWVGGVDLNRNYDFQWNALTESGSSLPRAEDYKGEEPFSEPETRAVRDFVESHDNIRFSITFHSGIELILYPWAYKEEYIDDNEIISACEAISSVTNYNYISASFLYTSSGTFIDWMYGKMSIPSINIEVYVNYTESYKMMGVRKGNLMVYEVDVRKFFNPFGDEIEKVCLKNALAVYLLATMYLPKRFEMRMVDIMVIPFMLISSTFLFPRMLYYIVKMLYAGKGRRSELRVNFIRRRPLND
ncbi:MAG: M14 family zinc carboxypeptidase [Candidatus Asgardarchaeia archaeon]